MMTDFDENDLPELNTISCKHGNTSADIDFSSNEIVLKKAISAAFDVECDNVVGLKNKKLVYPLGFVAESGKEHPELFLFSTFEILVDTEGSTTATSKSMEVKRDISLFNSISLTDLLFITNVIDCLALCEVDLKEFRIFCKAYQFNGLITKNNYDLMIWNLIPKAIIDEDSVLVDTIFLHFSHLFTLVKKIEQQELSIKSTQEVDGDEVSFATIYLALVCIAPQAIDSKIQEFMLLFDTEDSSYVHIQNFRILVVASLVVSVAFCPEMFFKDTENLIGNINREVNIILASFQQFLKAASEKMRFASKLIFTQSQMLDWYEEKGKYELGILVFISPSTIIASFSDGCSDDYYSMTNGTVGLSGVTTVPDPIIFTLSFQRGETFEIMLPEVHTVDLLVSLTRFKSLSMSVLESMIGSHCGTTTISKECFNKIFKEILQEHNNKAISEENCDILWLVIGRMFEIFSLCYKDGIRTRSIVTGLSFLCVGKKSEKLATLFKLYGGSKEYVDPDDLASMFFGLLVFFLLIKEDASDYVDWIAQFKNYGSILSYSLFKALQRNPVINSNISPSVQIENMEDLSKLSLTFEEFGKWYNVCGKESSSWIELLDLTKWPLQLYPTHKIQEIRHLRVNKRRDQSLVNTKANEVTETELLDSLQSQNKGIFNTWKSLSISPDFYDNIIQLVHQTDINAVQNIVAEYLLQRDENNALSGNICTENNEIWLDACAKAASSFAAQGCQVFAFIFFCFFTGQATNVRSCAFLRQHVDIGAVDLIQVLLACISIKYSGGLSKTAMESIRAFTANNVKPKIKDLNIDILLVTIRLAKTIVPQSFFLLFGNSLLENDLIQYSFSLCMKKNIRNTLHIRKASCQLISRIVAKRRVSLEAFLKKLASNTSKNLRDPSKLWKLISNDVSPVGWKSFTERMFAVIDKYNFVDSPVFLIMFLDGKKSVKLESSFTIFSELSKRSMALDKDRRFTANFFFMFLSCIACLNSEPDHRCLSQNYEHCIVMGTEVHSSAQKSILTFHDVALWYSSVGNRKMSWIELLDLSKWPIATQN